MAKYNEEERLERFNVVRSIEDTVWLDQFAGEVLAGTGAKVSRSEIIRAALATLRELHRAAPDCPGRFLPLAQCRSGSDLAMIGVIASLGDERAVKRITRAGGTRQVTDRFADRNIAIDAKLLEASLLFT